MGARCDRAAARDHAPRWLPRAAPDHRHVLADVLGHDLGHPRRDALRAAHLLAPDLPRAPRPGPPLRDERVLSPAGPAGPHRDRGRAHTRAHARRRWPDVSATGLVSLVSPGGLVVIAARLPLATQNRGFRCSLFILLLWTSFNLSHPEVQLFFLSTPFFLPRSRRFARGRGCRGVADEFVQFASSCITAQRSRFFVFTGQLLLDLELSVHVCRGPWETCDFFFLFSRNTDRLFAHK